MTTRAERRRRRARNAGAWIARVASLLVHGVASAHDPSSTTHARATVAGDALAELADHLETEAP